MEGPKGIHRHFGILEVGDDGYFYFALPFFDLFIFVSLTNPARYSLLWFQFSTTVASPWHHFRDSKTFSYTRTTRPRQSHRTLVSISLTLEHGEFATNYYCTVPCMSIFEETEGASDLQLGGFFGICMRQADGSYMYPSIQRTSWTGQAG